MASVIDAKLIDDLANRMVQEGIITSDQLTVARVSHQNLGDDLGRILVRKGFVSEQQLLIFLGKALSIPYVSLKKYPVDAELVKKLPAALARRHHLVPIRKDNSEIVVAMSDPMDLFALEEVRQSVQASVRPVLASSTEIEELIEHYYGQNRRTAADASMESIQSVSSDEEYVYPEEEKRLEEIATGPKVVHAVNEMIVRAYMEAASDIHLEPSLGPSRLRYRIDGILEEREGFAKEMHLPLVSRIKILAGLDIAERRIPQDGRIRLRIGGKAVDLRVATYPTLHGEKVVIRLLSTGPSLTIEGLGFTDAQRRLFAEIIEQPHGIFLVVGPTGSGKSTTLYAALERLNSPEKNIISIEDPVEREIQGISQAQINPKAGVTFASALRAILRQDPDVIMIGEIRDRETAEIAVRSAITGHMVLSTLHTNTSAGALTRLLDLGVESFLLSSALVGVLSQRLVRKICPECREEMPAPRLFEKMAHPDREMKFYRGKGCGHCRMTGYAGRIGIFELAPIRGALKTLINEHAAERKFEEEFRKLGVRTLLEDGFSKVAAGLTTLEEVHRATQEE